MQVITLILRVLAFVLFAIATPALASVRFNLIGAGLACWVLADIVDGNLSGVGD